MSFSIAAPVGCDNVALLSFRYHNTELAYGTLPSVQLQA
jgi:hypothetical protein